SGADCSDRPGHSSSAWDFWSSLRCFYPSMAGRIHPPPELPCTLGGNEVFYCFAARAGRYPRSSCSRGVLGLLAHAGLHTDSVRRCLRGRCHDGWSSYHRPLGIRRSSNHLHHQLVDFEANLRLIKQKSEKTIQIILDSSGKVLSEV